MKPALIFISYHPGALPDLLSIEQTNRHKSISILIICRHLYASDEIINLYSQNFDKTIVLPEINYETFFLRGLVSYFRFISAFRKQIRPLLNKIEYFHIISDCSAYFPVNALLAELKKDKRCKSLISTRNDYDHTNDIHLLKTIRARFYAILLGLYTVFCHKTFGYEYVNEPRDKIVELISPFVRDNEDNKKNTVPTYRIMRTIAQRSDEDRDTVIFYSDMQLDGYYDLSKEEFEKRLSSFFQSFAKFYKGYVIICKPHPMDGARAMAGMEYVNYELYSGSLTSQMHLDKNLNRLKACYSVSSSSLLYSASLGVPSYTLYKYLEFNGEYPKTYFESEEMCQNPFLLNIKDLAEIGSIDSLYIEPQVDNSKKLWQEVLN